MGLRTGDLGSTTVLRKPRLMRDTGDKPGVAQRDRARGHALGVPPK